MFITSIFFTYKAIKIYIDSPLVTNLAIVPNVTMDFPELLICYNGGLNVSAFEKFNLSDNLIHVLSAATFSNYDNKNAVEQARHELTDFMMNQNITIIDVYDKFGYQCDDMIQSVSVNFEDTNCSKRKAEKVISLRGPCYALKNLGSQWYPGGYGAGIQLKLKAPRSSYANYFPSESFEYHISNDYSITIEKFIGQEPSFRQILIPINSNVQITLNPKLYKRTPKLSQCDDSEGISSSCFSKC